MEVEVNLFQLMIQAFVVVIVIGGAYSLWQTTHAYGGLIGNGLKWIGAGMLVFALEAIDQVLGDLSVVASAVGENAEVAHRILLLLGLLFAAVGFSKLTKVTGKAGDTE